MGIQRKQVAHGRVFVREYRAVYRLFSFTKADLNRSNSGLRLTSTRPSGKLQTLRVRSLTRWQLSCGSVHNAATISTACCLSPLHTNNARSPHSHTQFFANNNKTCSTCSPQHSRDLRSSVHLKFYSSTRCFCIPSNPQSSLLRSFQNHHAVSYT